MNKKDKLIITGVAGLQGQNTILSLRDNDYHNIIAIDYHKENIKILKELNLDIPIICSDLSKIWDGENSFKDGAVIIQMHAQITSLHYEDYERNTQERIICVSSITNCSLRPTLMFGLFDKKHFGCLFRFMKKNARIPDTRRW